MRMSIVRVLGCLVLLCGLPVQLRAALLTGSGDHLPLPDPNLGQPTYQLPEVTVSGGTFTATWTLPASFGWLGVVDATGPLTFGGNSGTTHFDFTSLPGGFLPAGTFFVFSDVDAGSGPNERLEFEASDGDGQIDEPWLDVPVGAWGTGTGLGGAILPIDLPGWDLDSAGRYIVDGSSVDGNPTLTFALRSNRDITSLTLVKVSGGNGFSFAAPEANAPHFLGYKARKLRQPLLLTDQFGSADHWLTRKLTLGIFFNPVDKNGEGIPDPDAHLSSYKVSRQTNVPVLKQSVEVINQFGVQQMTLALNKPAFILVPTRKAGHPFPSGLDHYTCYQGKSQTSVSTVVTVDDQWLDSPKNAELRRAAALCTPVEKTFGDVTIPIFDRALHYVLYGLKPESGVGAGVESVYLENQFEQGVTGVRPPSYLLVPSSKRVLP